MVKRILLILLLGASLPLLAQKNNKLIEWSETRLLKASDFKAKPNRTSSYAALTASGISCNINYDGEVLTIETTTTFNPKESWMKDKTDPVLLAHEQFHFNIAELYAREFRKKILSKKFNSDGKKLIKEVTSIYEQTIKELGQFQRQYDRETDHSINRSAQLQWEQEVEKRLIQLKEYDQPKLAIRL